MTTAGQAPPSTSTDDDDATIEQGDTPILESHFVLGGGLRQVVPYLFDFKCTVKPRSEGALLVDFMASEFPAMPRSYYEAAVATGRARADAPGRGGGPRPPRGARKRGGEEAAAEDGALPRRRQPLPLFTPLSPSSPLPHNALVRHLLHRHEPPALALPIPLLGEAGDLFAVGKPPGLPVHAAGGYRKNTVVGVLEAAERAKGASAASTFSPPLPVHRLDKPVSGVLVLARTAAAADAAGAAIARREVAKTYVARVSGVFPGGLEEAKTGGGGGGGKSGALALPTPTLAPHLSPAEPFGEEAGDDASAFTLDLALGWEPASHTAFLCPDGPRTASEIPGARHQAAGARGEGKPAATAFRRLGVAPDGLTSLVSCRPLTGRSHQIRLHLAALGHPIANDAAYGGGYPGPERPQLPAHGGAPAPSGGTAGHGAGGGGGCFDDGSDAGVAASLAALAQCEWVGAPVSVRGVSGDGSAAVASPAPRRPPSPPPPTGPTAASALAACPFCPALARPWRPAELLPLWLHAARYVGPGWDFACPVPRWGEVGWVPEREQKEMR